MSFSLSRTRPLQVSAICWFVMRVVRLKGDRRDANQEQGKPGGVVQRTGSKRNVSLERGWFAEGVIRGDDDVSVCGPR